MDNSSDGNCVTLEEDEYCVNAWNASWKDLTANVTFDSISEASLEIENASEKADVTLESISNASFESIESDNSLSSLEKASISDYSRTEDPLTVVIENDLKSSPVSEKSELIDDLVITVKNDVYTKRRNRKRPVLPIFASDGLINLQEEDVITIHEKDSTHNIIQRVKQCAVDNGGFKRDFWLSVGNYEATFEDNPKLKGLCVESRWPKTIREVVKSVFDEVNAFEKEVLSHGGRVYLVALIPCPKLVDNCKDSIYSEKLQQLGSRIFIRMNKEIDLFNKRKNHFTEKINKYLEVKRKKSFGRSGECRRKKILEHKSSDFYPGRDQRKIKMKCFKKDKINLTKQSSEKICEVIHKAIDRCQKNKKTKKSS